MRLLVLSDRNRGPPPDLPSESDVPLFYHLDKRTLRNHARASWNQQNAEFSQLHLYYQENFFSVANLLISTRILGTVDYTAATSVSSAPLFTRPSLLVDGPVLAAAFPLLSASRFNDAIATTKQQQWELDLESFYDYISRVTDALTALGKDP
ncbi:hypothetical protein T4E_10813 [Trichinella pseudospiralis]|uniref:Uncharacterized protein n=1 Tax=Trichinella pseudospiralis TaxID=6337 RepID=A0A0V0XIK2_TRIPS|nr:hypothetical protein T4E_10813 [Trichinella pseudospiralis]